MEKLHSFPFRSIYKAMEILEHGNPARQKSLNLFEPERGGKPANSQFSGAHPADVYASVLAGFKQVEMNMQNPIARVAALMYWRGARKIEQDVREGRTYTKERMVIQRFNVTEIAEHLHIGKRTIYRWLDQFHDDLEREFRRRDLIPPAEEQLN